MKTPFTKLSETADRLLPEIGMLVPPSHAKIKFIEEFGGSPEDIRKIQNAPDITDELNKILRKMGLFPTISVKIITCVDLTKSDGHDLYWYETELRFGNQKVDTMSWFIDNPGKKYYRLLFRVMEADSSKPLLTIDDDLTSYSFDWRVVS